MTCSGQPELKLHAASQMRPPAGILGVLGCGLDSIMGLIEVVKQTEDRQLVFGIATLTSE